jgi:hypothetical protein
MMPQTATRQALAAGRIPAPRTEQAQDPNAWVFSLSPSSLTLALALSDLPRTRAEQDQALGGLTDDYLPAHQVRWTPRAHNPAGVRQLTAWVVQGIERAGGELALWQAACQWRSHNLNRTWSTPAGKAFARRFGSQRRTQHATDWAGRMPRASEATTVRITLTARTVDVVHGLGVLFAYTSARTHSTRPETLVYRMSRYEAHMVALHFDRTLIPFVHGGYTLA